MIDSRFFDSVLACVCVCVYCIERKRQSVHADWSTANRSVPIK